MLISTNSRFGPAKSWTFGNSQTIIRTFDLDGRMTGNSVESTVSYDAASRITGLTSIFASRGYGYDALDRLASFADPSGNGSYSYDATGNRTSHTGGGTTNTYAIAAASNRIASISDGTATATYAYDANGSTTGDGTNSYGFDTAGRLVQANGPGGSATNALNGLGQRVMKTAGGITTLFAYDEAGKLLGEYDGAGTVIQETVWLGDTPLAVLTPTGTYYVHADHLNTPRQINDGTGAAVWTWDIATFGASAPNPDPTSSGTPFVHAGAVLRRGDGTLLQLLPGL